MIVVAGVLEIEPADVETAIHAAQTAARETRREPGCRAYAFYRDIETDNRFHVFEEWEDDAALQRHFETDHMLRFRVVLSGLRITRRAVTRYVVGETSAL